MVITEEQISEQVAAVEAAEVKLDQAEAHHAEAGSERAVQELRVARAQAHAARDLLRHLRARYAAEQAASRAREAAERAFSQKRREVLARRLADARDEAAHAVAALDKAAAEALAAVAGYGAVVRESAAELVGAGLRAGEGGEDGGTVAGSVYLGGEAWRPADPLGVLEYLLAARAAAENPSHPLAMRRYSAESLAGKAAREDLLKAAGR